MKSWPEATTAEQLVYVGLQQPIDNFMASRGKRIRGALVKLSYAMAGGRGDVPSEVSQAIEWLHAGSLVIDDVQDDSQLRRGRPTLHRELGIPLAINAGNFMYFRALEIMLESNLPAELCHEARAEMVRAARICHEGQAIDLAAKVHLMPAACWQATAEAITAQKTGVLVELAMRLGAIAAGCDRPLKDKLAWFGRRVGSALQMRNDLDEVKETARWSSDSGELLRMDDLKNCRITWPWVWFAQLVVQAEPERLAQELGKASTAGDLSQLGLIAAQLARCVDDFGVEQIRRQIEEPVRLLGEYVLEDDALHALRDCLQPIEHGVQLPAAANASITETAS